MVTHDPWWPHGAHDPASGEGRAHRRRQSKQPVMAEVQHEIPANLILANLFAKGSAHPTIGSFAIALVLFTF